MSEVMSSIACQKGFINDVAAMIFGSLLRAPRPILSKKSVAQAAWSLTSENAFVARCYVKFESRSLCQKSKNFNIEGKAIEFMAAPALFIRHTMPAWALEHLGPPQGCTNLYQPWSQSPS
ncbi:hypothetical protein, partial [Pseudomonas syringae]|uniref:hypothetical protein n=1 Tax=Pseudomonas syringae TaxID=317 RepID=UPI0013735CF9